jgi:hypothetical protein
MILSNLTSHISRLTSLVLVLVSCLLALSCKPNQSITHTRIERDTTIIREIPRIIHVPGATVQTQSINIDSLVSLIRAGVDTKVIQNTLIREDPETRLRVGILIDELGNLTALCEQQDRLIQSQDTEITRLREIIDTTVTVRKPSRWEKLQTAIFWMGIGILLMVLRRMIQSIYK